MRIHSNSLDDTNNISRLDQAFSLTLTEVIKREINRLHRDKVTGDELLTELAIIYNRYNMTDLEKHQNQTEKIKEVNAKVICSASFV